MKLRIKEALYLQQHRWAHLKPRNCTVRLGSTNMSTVFTKTAAKDSAVGYFRVSSVRARRKFSKATKYLSKLTAGLAVEV
jgi:hypothetical protein